MTVTEVFLNYAYYGGLLIGVPIFLSFLIYHFFYKPHFVKKLKEWGLDPKDNPFN